VIVRLPRQGQSVATADAGSFRGARRRTLLLRVILVAAALGCLVAATASARGLASRPPGVLPSGSTGVVVFDLSLSIVERDYPRVAFEVRRLIKEDAPVGLVVFSDVPYELLPPGTPARELRPLLRLLTAVNGKVPPNPWSDSFRSGTVISAALELAAGMLDREHVEHGSIVLVSDLETAPDDVPRLTRLLRELRDRGIRVRVVPLSPIAETRALFESLLGPDAFSEPPAPGSAEVERPVEQRTARLPRGLLLLGGLLFAALAAHEGLTGRLALPRAEGGRA
jgi:hypothetical protein